MCDDCPVGLKSKDFDVLLVLLRNRSRLVTKAQLMDAVWPNAFVAEANLGVHIASLRRALREHSTTHTYIQTVHRFGYRFVGLVNLIDGPPSTSAANANDRAADVPQQSEQITRDVGIDGGSAEAILTLSGGLRIEARKHSFGTEIMVAIPKYICVGSAQIIEPSSLEKPQNDGVDISTFHQDGMRYIKVAVND